MNNISKGSVWKNTLSTCTTPPFLFCEHYCNYFHIQENVFLAEEQQYWTGIGRTSDRKLGTFKTKSLEWFTASLEQLTSARTGKWLWVQAAPELHTHLGISIVYPSEMVQPREVEEEWVFPPPGQYCCRKFMCMRMEWDFEKFAWALRGFLSNHNIGAAGGSKIYRQHNAK